MQYHGEIEATGWPKFVTINEKKLGKDFVHDI